MKMHLIWVPDRVLSKLNPHICPNSLYEEPEPLQLYRFVRSDQFGQPSPHPTGSGYVHGEAPDFEQPEPYPVDPGPIPSVSEYIHDEAPDSGQFFYMDGNHWLPFGRFIRVPSDSSYPIVGVTNGPEDAMEDPFIGYCPDLHRDQFSF